MEYQLNEVRPGEFEVVRSMPVVMGTFTDPDVAQKFMIFLELEDKGEQRALASIVANADETPIAPAGSASSVEMPESTVEPDQATPSVSPAKPPSAPDTPATKFDGEAWTELELAAAFKLLSEGQKLKDVAAWHGKCWKRLRSKWAAQCRAKKTPTAESGSGALAPVSEPAKTPLEKVTAAVAELNAQEQCNVCGRPFRPTPDNLDLCARCRHGA